MSANPAFDVQKRVAIRSHLGIAESLKLVAWAKVITAAWPTASVWITGSVLERKDFRDVDVTVVLANPEDAGLDNGQRLDSAWDLIAAALSALAREMTGLPVEARCVWLGYGRHPADVGGYELAAGVQRPGSETQPKEGQRVGICGNRSPSAFGTSEVCTLPHGHGGWHEADADLGLSPMRWSSFGGVQRPGSETR